MAFLGGCAKPSIRRGIPMIDQEPECPECGEDMVIRKNRKTGEQFYGCSLYPQCDGTDAIQSKPQKGDYPAWASDPDQ